MKNHFAQSMQRRQFILSSLAAAGLTEWAKPLRAAPAKASASSRIKIGFWGMTHSHGPSKLAIAAQSTAFELVGVVEANSQVRGRLAGEGVRLMEPEQLLAEADLVAVESDVKDHAWQAKRALEAGKHVHLEKPPSETLEELRELVALARQKERLLQMGYMWRFHPGINAALEAARQGWLGDVYLVRATINTQISGERRPEWALFRGGTMFELGCHMIDPVVRLLGRPKKVHSHLNTAGRFGDHLADNTVALFEYERALAIVTSATLQPNAHQQRSFEVLGTNGSFLIQPIEAPQARVDLAKAAGPYAAGSQQVPMPEYRRYVAEFEELAVCLRTGRPLSVTMEEDLMVHEALLRACDML